MPAFPSSRSVRPSGAAGPVLLRAIRKVLGGLLPCPACGVRAAGATGVCATCARRAAAPGLHGDRLWLGIYEGPLGRIVRALKYRGVTGLAPWLGDRLGAEVLRVGWRPTVVCAVPLHRSRRRRRGFNQAELIARQAARRLAVPYRPLLRRTRATPQQARMHRAARLGNVRGAFASVPAEEASVLLIDDVWTTGATASACRAALLAAGAGRVRIAVVAVAHGPAGSPGDPADGASAPRTPAWLRKRR